MTRRLRLLLLAALATASPAARAGPPPARAASAGPHQSHGHPNAGRLVGAKRWADTPHARRLPDHAASAAYGMPGLVELTQRAARAVARRHPRSVLLVGDLSLEHGGPIAGHHSHQNGRDIDVGFYTADAGGKPMLTSSFLPFDAQGRATTAPGVRFDDARNWSFVRALLTDGRAEVRAVFVANWLRDRLLREAERQGAPRELVARAAAVMMQPPDAEPHHDHFHVRIACVESQRAAFCRDDSLPRPGGEGGPPFVPVDSSKAAPAGPFAPVDSSARGG
ncbi:MAG TPA: penicillin-insensitive murein endopeptidase [Polyangiaceae bacterium]|nr:penicillin-insensitive murein endopeptidase [Polyangiaceae bacterium]